MEDVKSRVELPTPAFEFVMDGCCFVPVCLTERLGLMFSVNRKDEVAYAPQRRLGMSFTAAHAGRLRRRERKWHPVSSVLRLVDVGNGNRRWGREKEAAVKAQRMISTAVSTSNMGPAPSDSPYPWCAYTAHAKLALCLAILGSKSAYT